MTFPIAQFDCLKKLGLSDAEMGVRSAVRTRRDVPARAQCDDGAATYRHPKPMRRFLHSIVSLNIFLFSPSLLYGGFLYAL